LPQNSISYRSHSHRALARWPTARRDVWNRFNGLPS